jgi:hypothetical protein
VGLPRLGRSARSTRTSLRPLPHAPDRGGPARHGRGPPGPRRDGLLTLGPRFLQNIHDIIDDRSTRWAAA